MQRGELTVTNPLLWFQDQHYRTVTGGFEVEGQKFEGGTLVFTSGVMELLSYETWPEFHEAIVSHMKGEWGDIDDYDRRQNEVALEQKLRLMSVKEIAGEVVWVITEAGRHETTLLLPEEY